MRRSPLPSLPSLVVVASLVLALACADDEPGTSDDGADETSATGDGDGDPTTGDGDGDPTTGDGDGDPTTGDGDGDGDPTTGDGDGDGDPTTTTGDGDGDPYPSLPPDFLATLTDVGGCGDVYIGASNPDATIGLLFNGAPLAATAHELGETQVRESTLPSADVDLRISLGFDLDQGCNDAGPLPVESFSWTAVSGTVTLTVVPTGMAEPWAVPADATLELSDVTFEAPGEEPVVIDAWTVTDVSVGWLPG